MSAAIRRLFSTALQLHLLVAVAAALGWVLATPLALTALLAAVRRAQMGMIALVAELVFQAKVSLAVVQVRAKTKKTHLVLVVAVLLLSAGHATQLGSIILFMAAQALLHLFWEPPITSLAAADPEHIML
jgi:hypothetical protein